MKAFVMWGAGSLGAAQVGMLQALSEHRIRVDLVVGASVGALNAAHYASRPDLAGVEELAELWLSIGRHDVYPRSLADMARVWASSLPRHPLHGALRALGALNYAFPVDPLTIEAVITGRRDHLFSNRALAQFLDKALPIDRLENTEIPLTVLAADARNGDPVPLSTGPALPALLASTAIPGLYPPVELGGRMLMDGGLARHTTLDVAVTCGADEVYVLSPRFSCRLPNPPSNVIGMLLHAYNLLAEQRMAASVARVAHHTTLHLLPSLCPAEVLPIDFRQTAELITAAAEATTCWLDGAPDRRLRPAPVARPSRPRRSTTLPSPVSTAS